MRYPKVVLKKIFNKLDRAQEVIRKCYFELENLGIVKFIEASSQTPNGLCFTGNKPEDDELYDMLLNIRFLEKKAKAEKSSEGYGHKEENGLSAEIVISFDKTK